jgi:hypothetical protein
MNFAIRFGSAFLLMVPALISYAQPVTSSAQSAKEQRQAPAAKGKSQPDRSQAEAKKLKGAQNEAGERYDQKVRAASTEMSMGIASVAPQAATKAGAKKTEKFEHHKKDAIKKSQ